MIKKRRPAVDWFVWVQWAFASGDGSVAISLPTWEAPSLYGRWLRRRLLAMTGGGEGVWITGGASNGVILRR